MKHGHQCCGLCNQGRRICPTPEACRVDAPTGQGDLVDCIGALGAKVAAWVLIVALVGAAVTVISGAVS